MMCCCCVCVCVCTCVCVCMGVYMCVHVCVCVRVCVSYNILVNTHLVGPNCKGSPVYLSDLTTSAAFPTMTFSYSQVRTTRGAHLTSVYIDNVLVGVGEGMGMWVGEDWRYKAPPLQGVGFTVPRRLGGYFCKICKDLFLAVGILHNAIRKLCKYTISLLSSSEFLT